ncbi:MAG: outer membrane protein transport protein [Cephaloticoccus sp.]|nr:outer membrane protein transport protein [Cephaloticoccus sp.]MCF7761125.1 outer membrane protein transport protein [Cephaloticoccus sp.]
MKNITNPTTIIKILASLVLISAIPSLRATNGMNMEGYGPVATAMGGTSMAYDNGTAAMINNPATLGLMEGAARFDLALGILGPSIEVTSPATAPNIFGVPANQTAKSTAKAFFMPAFGYTRRSGDFVYGLGVMGQGGMGCEYDANTWRGLGYDLKNRTEVSVGRVIVPLAYKVNDNLQIGGTVDFMWAGMDLKMAMSGNQFFDLVMPTSQQFGSASGTIVQSFGQILSMLPPGTSVDYAYFNFSNGSPFTGAARSYGYGAKIGILYTPSKDLSLGLTYHSQSELADMTTNGGELSFQLNIPGMGQMPQTLKGNFRIKDFQWPAMLGVGFAYHADPRWLITADLRQVYWKSVMKEFSMAFVASNDASNGSFAGQNLDATLFQSWDDQTVVMLGAAYEASDRLTLRFGGNFANNPVPDKYMNCLFPAIVKKHLTAGFGWKINGRSSIETSFTYGFKVDTINGSGAGVSHSQTNLQTMYSYRF